MNSIIKNVGANFFGTFSQALIPLSFNVLYFRLVSHEAYGLIGLFSTLFAVSTLLDFGLGATLQRESALCATVNGEMHRLRGIVRTFESLQIAIAAFFGLGLVILAHWISVNWLHVSNLDPQISTKAIELIGLVIAIQQPRSLFAAGLNGLQRQVLVNFVTASSLLARGLLGAIALAVSNGDITKFFYSQLFVSVFETVSLRFCLLKAIGGSGRFDKRHLYDAYRFALGSGATMLVATVVMFGDKIILSKLLPLGDFGVYSLITMLCSGIPRLVSPFATAYGPVFASSFQNGSSSIARDYIRATSIASALVIGAGCVIVVFSQSLMWALSGGKAGPVFSLVLSMFAVGTIANSLQQLPHCLQLASGWTRLAFTTNLVAAIFYLPALVFFTPEYGVIVPPVLWAISSLCQFPFFIVCTHRRLPVGRASDWLYRCVFRPLLYAIPTLLILRWLLPFRPQMLMSLAEICIASLLAAASVFISVPEIRGLAVDAYKKFL